MNKKIKKIFTYFLICFYLATIFNIYYAEAYQEGDYFICDFSQYSDYTHYFNESVAGVVWLSGHCDIASQHYVYNEKWTINPTDSPVTSWFNLSMRTININYTMWNSAFGAGDNIISHFYTNDGNRMFYLKHVDAKLYIYDDDLTIINAIDCTDNEDLFINISFNITQNRYYFDIYNMDDGISYKTDYTVSNIDYVAYIKHVSTEGAGYTYAGMTDFKILICDTPDLWETETDNEIGSVTITGTELVAQLITESNFILENDYNLYYDIELARLALAVGDLTDLSNLDIKLRIQDTNYGSYDTYYVYENRYILIWDLNRIINSGNNQFEINFIKTGGTPSIYILYTSTDIDNDGDTEYKYSYSTDNLNGIYDGTITESNDLIYELWYNYTTTAPDVYGDVANYSYIGDLYGDYSTFYMYHPYIEGKYFSTMKSDIKALDLLVDIGQYSIDSSLSNYFAFISGESIGNPSYWIPFSDDTYVLRWIGVNVDVSLDNEYPIFEFYHPISNAIGEYWHIKANGDINNDGYINRKWHNNNLWYGDNIYNGDGDNAVEWVYRFWYINESIDINPDYPDFISTDKSTYTQYIDNVYIDGTTSDLSYTNTVHLYREGEEINNIDVWTPKYVYSYSFSYAFIPRQWGSYKVTLERQGDIKSDYNFTVQNISDDNFFLFTSPNPSYSFSSFNLMYRYNHSENKDGKIILSYDSNLQRTSSYIEQWYINSSVEMDNITNIYIPREGLYYFILAIEISEGIWSSKITHKHIVKDREYDNILYVEYNPLILILYRDALLGTQIIHYEHNHLGSPNILLKVNGITQENIGDSSIDSTTYKVISTGLYVVTMILQTANGSITLATANFTATSTVEIPTEEVDTFAGYGMYFGVGIICLFLVIPFGLSYSVGFEAPTIMYFGFGCTGAGLAVGLGFLDQYWILLLVVALVTGAIMTYYKYH